MMCFLDCEFDGFGGNLISFALVMETGKELYWASVENIASAKDEWVLQNVIPIIDIKDAHPLSSSSISIQDALDEFLDQYLNYHIIADWPDDIVYFCRSMIPSPGFRIKNPKGKLTFEVCRLDAYPSTLPGAIRHNALWDARALRKKYVDTYE